MANVYFGDTVGAADENWNTSIRFTVSGVTVTPTAGATYTNNGITFTVTSASIAAGVGTINAGGSGTSTGSGTLTKVSGTGDATIAFSDQEDVNWFSTPGNVTCCCCCNPGVNNPGTPLGRLPTTADNVIIHRTISVGPYITWPSTVTVAFLSTAGGSTAGNLGAGTFSGTVTGDSAGLLSGTIVCNGTTTAVNYSGGTFNGPVSSGGLGISGGTFTSSVTINSGGGLAISGGTFNGTIVNGAGTTTSMAGTCNISGSPVFNCAFPNNFFQYVIAGGIYDRDLTIGLFSPTSGLRLQAIFNAGFSSSRNITVNLKRTNLGSGSVLTINGGVFTGLITVNRIAASLITVTGGSYSPPAVTTPAIKSGNNMTFSSSAIPTDWGFAAAGLTFSPTILLSGTSNDILGSGLP